VYTVPTELTLRDSQLEGIDAELQQTYGPGTLAGAPGNTFNSLLLCKDAFCLTASSDQAVR